MEHMGIDVHKKDGQICLLSQEGELIERRVRTEPERFAEVLGSRPQARILIESATQSEWVARCWEGLGHKVIVADSALCTFGVSGEPYTVPRSRVVRPSLTGPWHAACSNVPDSRVVGRMEF